MESETNRLFTFKFLFTSACVVYKTREETVYCTVDRLYINMAIFLWLFIFFFFIHNTTGESIDGFKVVFDPRNTPFVQPEGGISTYVSQQKYSDELLVFNGPISEIDPNSAKPEFQVLARMSSPVRGIIDPNFPQDLKYSFKNMIPLLLHFHTKPLGKCLFCVTL